MPAFAKNFTQYCEKFWVQILYRICVGVCFIFYLDLECRAADTVPLNLYEDVTEADYPVRSRGRLLITNSLGSVVLHGWALDKIRVKIIKKTQAHTVEEANKNFSKVSHRYLTDAHGIEISSKYGANLEIDARHQVNLTKETQLNIVVFAPWKLKANLWVTRGNVELKNWNEDAIVRSKTGELHIEGVHANEILAVCPECSMTITHMQGKLRCFGSAGSIDLAHISNHGPIYIESDSGPITAKYIEGEQFYLTKSGDIAGTQLKGVLEFHSLSGRVNFKDVSGFASGNTEVGDILIKMRSFEFSDLSGDKASIESKRGMIQVTLPNDFAAQVAFRSTQGHLTSGFSVESTGETSSSQSRSPSGLEGDASKSQTQVLQGRVNQGGHYLGVSSGGDVSVFRARY